MKKAKTLQGFSRKLLMRHFDYNYRTGVIKRKIAAIKGNWPAGQVVGTVDGKGYLHVNFRGKFIRLHRMAFLFRYGWVPERLDHRDRDRRNNRIINLRPTTDQLNAGNSFYGHNTSGIKGVSWNTKDSTWHAQIKIFGKQTYLGSSSDPVEAAALYNAAARKHFKDHAFLNQVRA